MQYLETREDGFPIGSGMVECGCKQFRARFAGPGMRWSRPGLERLLPVRAAIMGHSFDQLWRAAYRKPQSEVRPVTGVSLVPFVGRCYTCLKCSGGGQPGRAFAAELRRGGRPARKDLYAIETVLEKPTPTEAELRLIVPGLRAGYYLCFFGTHI